SVVPSPTLPSVIKSSPSIILNDIKPLVAVNVTCTILVEASKSLIEIVFDPSKVNDVSSFVSIAVTGKVDPPSYVLTGASFIDCTLIKLVKTLLGSDPSLTT